MKRASPYRAYSGMTVHGKTFHAWLMCQQHRGDRIGDLARLVATDDGWPKHVNTFELFRSHLRRFDFEDKDRWLWMAWSEWKIT